MKLKAGSGIIAIKIANGDKVNMYHCIFTQDGKWAISRHGVTLGEVDTIAEAEAFIAANLENIRRRLRLAQDKADAKNDAGDDFLRREQKRVENL